MSERGSTPVRNASEDALSILYAEGVAPHSPGSRSAPWEDDHPCESSTLKGCDIARSPVIAPFQGAGIMLFAIPRVRCATLGFGVEPRCGSPNHADRVGFRPPTKKNHSPPTTNLLLQLWLGCIAFCLLGTAPTALADTVIYATGENARNRTTVNGTILDQTGEQTVVKRESGGEQSIPTASVQELQFQRTATHEAADQLFEAGEYDEAIRSYLSGMRGEPRVWVRRMMVARLVQAYVIQGQIERAGRAFLELVRSDPTTHYYSLIPLAWRPNTGSLQLERWAEQWLAVEQGATASLIGASWLLSGSRRGEALDRLRQLAADRDPRIAFLAQAQTWRTRTVTADVAEVDRWDTVVQRMPAELRGGPYFILGKGRSAVSQHKKAALAFLRVPILYETARTLVPWALLSAGRELERIEQAKQAVTLYQEILRDHAEHPATAEARALLERFSDAARRQG